MSLSIKILSGLSPKSPAAILLSTNQKRFLLDAGAQIGTSDIPWPLPENIDAVFISHDHVDHMGGFSQLPAYTPIYCSAFVASQLPPHANTHILPMKGSTNVMGIQVTTGAAGHAMGGIWFHFAVNGGVFYSGDFSLESELFRFDPPPIANIALLDMSYGNYNIPIDEQKKSLKKELMPHQHKGEILFPVPPSGRCIELALWLSEQFPSRICLDSNGLSHIHDALLQKDMGLKLTTKKKLKRLSQTIRTIDSRHDIKPTDIILAGSADLDYGLTSDLIDIKTPPMIMTIFTGHMGALAQKLDQKGHTKFVRWNAHPRLSDTIRLSHHLQCQTIIPLFHPELISLQPSMFRCHLHPSPYWEPSYATH